MINKNELRGIYTFQSFEMSELFAAFRIICQQNGFVHLFPAILYSENSFATSFEDEMFFIQNKKLNNRAVLAPEYTAIVTEYFYNSDRKEKSFYYISPCFRYERPQKNRKRQFWQLGIEDFNNDRLNLILIMNMMQQMLYDMDIKHQLRINFIGSANVRRDFILQNREVIKSNVVCTQCFLRLEKNNIFPILECSKCKVMQYLPSISSLNDVFEKEKHSFIEKLQKNNISFFLDESLFRGIDYYGNIIFEYIVNDTVVGGGGTYSIDGKNGQGMALGADRLSAIMNIKCNKIDLFCFDISSMASISIISSVINVQIHFYPKKVSDRAIFVHSGFIVFQNKNIQQKILINDINKSNIIYYYDKIFGI